VAVAATPDPVRGDEVAALVVAEDAAAGQEDAAAIARWALDEMAYYKVPGWIGFVSELPRTPTEKIMRAALKDAVAGQRAAGTLHDTRAFKKRTA